MEYAVKKGVSLSTLRRHIKANKVQYKVENGRYLLLDDADSLSASLEFAGDAKRLDDSGSLHSKVHRLECDLHKAQEEIAELKMLIALYEEKIAPQKLDS